jgi:small subunit ribosomal protein S17
MARTRETKQQAESAEPQAGAAAAAAAPAGAGPEAPQAAAGSPGASPAPQPATTRPARRVQVKVGKVVSNKMQKTVIVTVENTATHRLYHRYMKRTSKFAAHDAENRCQVGDLVEIVSSRPLSHSKRWRVREVLKRAE